MRISFTAVVVALCAITVGVAPALADAGEGGVAASDAACPFPLTRQNRPVAPPFAPAETATFVDPTVVVQGAENVRVSQQDYIAPFARLIAEGDGDDDDGGHRGGICIEESSNVQDNTLLRTDEDGSIHVGEEAIIAHGAMMVAEERKVSIAHRSACEPGTHELPAPGTHPDMLEREAGETNGELAARRGRQALANALADADAHYECGKVPAFIGFNALNLSHIEDGALLSVAGRLAPGIILRSGYSSLPGKSLDTQAQADNPALGEVRYVTAGDFVFMEGVIHVNRCLARGYTNMFRAIPSSVRGINLDPGNFHQCEFNDDSEPPSFQGVRTIVPNPPKNIRIIGDAFFEDSLAQVLANISDNTSIRADEGEPFEFGHDVRWGFGTTFHALEPSVEDPEVGVRVQAGAVVGRRVVIHGGGRRTRSGGGPDDRPTELDPGVVVEPWAVIFRSDVGHNSHVGYKAVLVAYDNAETTEQIPDRCVKFTETPPGACAYYVEW